jgi:hemerythrin
MDQTGYIERDGHKELHRKLVGDVLKYNDRIERGDEKVLGELMAFIKGWLIEHIQKTDKKLGAHLQKTGLV